MFWHLIWRLDLFSPSPAIIFFLFLVLLLVFVRVALSWFKPTNSNQQIKAASALAYKHSTIFRYYYFVPLARLSSFPLLDLSLAMIRAVDDRSAKRSPPRPPEKSQRLSVDVSAGNPLSKQSPEPEVTPVPAEKLNLERFECPRIYLSLSRKEKEDDFLAMKGTKLPQRPKKRAKNIDRTLQVQLLLVHVSSRDRHRFFFVPINVLLE